MRRISWLFVLILLTGCVPITSVRLFNHLPIKVTVVTCDGAIDIPSGGTTTLSTYLCGTKEHGDVFISGENVHWEYRGLLSKAAKFFAHERGFAETRLFRGAMVQAQLEPNGVIMVVHPGVSMPSQDSGDVLRFFPDQP